MGRRTLSLLAGAALAACAGSQKLDAKSAPSDTPDTAGIADGERELTVGNPGRAIAILERIGPDDSAYAYAQQLLGLARDEIEAIAREWVSEIDLLIATQEYSEARARCRFLLEDLPLRGEARAEVEKRLGEVEVGMRDAESLLEDNAAQVRDFLLHDDQEAALRALRSARSLVWELDRDRALVWERIISAAELRLDKADGGKRRARRAAAPTHAAAKPKKKIERGKGAPVEPEPEVAAGTAPAAEPTPEQLHVGTLLRQAEGHRERKDFFRAIQAYQAVLRLDRAHEGAAAALKELEPQRQALVKEYMEKAQQHFLRQNLTAAAPYYRRVLVLEPTSEAANEGLRMYENLERIRRGSAKDSKQ